MYKPNSLNFVLLGSVVRLKGRSNTALKSVFKSVLTAGSLRALTQTQKKLLCISYFGNLDTNMHDL